MGGAPLIADTPERSRELLSAFRAATGHPAPVPEDDILESTVGDPGFPGGLISLPTADGEPSVFYAAAATSAEWRRLRPLLLAFAGPTLTDFAGAPTLLRTEVAHEQVLAAAGLAAVARLEAPAATKTSTSRALRRLVTLVRRAPPDSRPAPESTGRLLARIRDHLNAFAIDDARQLLERCRSEHRLDALNLRFLEIEILATARDWPAILALPAFDDLLRTRRPPAISAALLEALYWTSVGVSGSNDAYTGVTRNRARSLIRVPPVVGLQDGGWRLHALEALSSEPPNRDLIAHVLASTAELGDLRVRLEAIFDAAGATAPETGGEPDPAAAVATAEISGTLTAFEQVQELLASLSEAERAALLEAAQPRASLAAMEATFGAESPPRDWEQWLTRLHEPSFTTALAVARQGAAEWPARLGDPIEIARLTDALVTAPDTPPLGDRLVEGLPHLVSWLMRDSEYPRAAGAPLYEAALDRILLSGRTSTPLLDSAAVLARGVLALGPSAADYRRLLSDLLEASGEAAGLRSAYWLIELLETTVAYPAADQAARDQFWQGALARLAPVVRHLSALQRLSLVRLAASAGWTHTFTEVEEQAPSASDIGLATRLAGQMVAIYTLTESAGAQAAETLRQIAPGVDVRVNSEHDGSRTLRSLAENADLFVIVAGSATHAATDAIRMRRGDRPLVYAAGKGSVSILRAIEDWYARPMPDA